MPTVITKTVKPAGGGDYTTLQAAINALPASLVTADQQWTIECYGGGNLGVGTFSGTTVTDATRYIKVTVPAAERHSGVWNTSKAYCAANAWNGVINTLPAYTVIEYLQVQQDGDDNGLTGVHADAVAGVRVHSCIIRPNPAITAPVYWGAESSAIYLGIDVPGSCYIWNNLLLGWNLKPDSRGLRVINHTSGKTYCYNNTFVNCATGVQDTYADIVCKNNLVYLATTAFSAGVGVGSDYNATSTATATGGANDRVNQTFTFANAAGGDYHLASGDGGAKGFGVDLSADASLSFSTDIDGQTRVAPWDIGADQYVGASGITGDGNAALAVTSVGAGQVAISGAGAGALALASVASGTVAWPGITGTGDAALNLTSVSTGAVAVNGAGSGALLLTLAATGTVGFPGITGDGNAAVVVQSVGSGTVAIAGTGSGALALSSSGSLGTVAIAGVGDSAVGISGAGAGAVLVTGTGTGALALTLFADGVVGSAPIIGNGNAALVLTASAAGTVVWSPISGVGDAPLVITTAATGTVLVQGIGTGALSLMLVATGIAGSSGTYFGVRLTGVQLAVPLLASVVRQAPRLTNITID